MSSSPCDFIWKHKERRRQRKLCTKLYNIKSFVQTLQLVVHVPGEKKSHTDKQCVNKSNNEAAEEQ
jgi:hypothetical protein